MRANDNCYTRNSCRLGASRSLEPKVCLIKLQELMVEKRASLYNDLDFRGMGKRRLGISRVSF